MAPAYKKCVLRPVLCMDVVLEVLVRLPVKSLIRFKCVSKSWHDTITSSTFINIHLDHARKPDVASLNSLLLYVANFLCKSATRIPTPEELKMDYCTFHLWQMRRLHLPPDDLNLSFDGCLFFPESTCNGLVCLQSEHHIALYNPSTRVHKLIPLRALYALPNDRHHYYNSFYLFGHAPQSNDYKVIRIVDLCSRHRKVPLHAEVEVQIYSLRNNAWKRGSETAFESMYPFYEQSSQKFVCGATYALFARCDDGYHNAMIARYDMDKETYQNITIPDYGNGILYLEAMDDRLALLVIGSRYLEVWILAKDADGIEPWTMLLSISHDETIDKSFARYDRPIAYWNGKIIFLRNDSVTSLYLFDVEERKLVDLGNCSFQVPFYYYFMACISSLVPLE